MDLSIKYIDAILRFIVKGVSREGSRLEPRNAISLPARARARASYPFFLYSGAQHGKSEK